MRIEFHSVDKVCTPTLVATRNIVAGEELFASYGAGYWDLSSKKLTRKRSLSTEEDICCFMCKTGTTEEGTPFKTLTK